MCELHELLIIDSDRDLTDVMRIRLALAGYRVDVSLDATSGVCAAISGQPDVILLHYGSRNLAGMDVLAKLRANPSTRSIPIIGYGVRTNMDRVANRLGLARYLKIPYHFDDLVEHVRRAVGNFETESFDRSLARRDPPHRPIEIKRPISLAIVANTIYTD